VRAREHRWMDESGCGKNPSEQRTYLLESTHGQTRQDMKRIQVGKGKGWRAQTDGQVRAWKESK